MSIKLTSKGSAIALAIATTSLFLACSAEVPLVRDVGPDPELPPPEKSLLPTVNIAPAIGWSEGGKPLAADGLR